MRTSAFPLLAVVASCLLTAPPPTRASEPRFIEFAIEDQFDREHTDSDFRNRVTLVLGGDRKGSRYRGLWENAIRDSLRARGRLGQVALCPVADVRGVPFFMKGFVKGKFPKDEESWVLLDWKGRFAQAYDFESDRCNLALFDADGALVHQAAEEDPRPAELDELLGAIDALAIDPTPRK